MGPGVDGSFNQGEEAGDDGGAGGLMEPVLGGHAEVVQVSGLEAVNQQGCPPEVENSVCARHRGGEKGSGL